MDTLQLLAASRCLQEEFAGRRLQGAEVEQGLAHLHFGRESLILAYRRPPLGLFWREVAKLPPKPAGPAAILGQKLLGFRLESLAMPVADRILRLDFVREDWLGADRSWTLMAECFGSRGALLLLDSEERIHWASRWDDLETGDARILPHARYRPPLAAQPWEALTDLSLLLHPRWRAALGPDLLPMLQGLLTSGNCGEFFETAPGDFYPLALTPEVEPVAASIALQWPTPAPLQPQEDLQVARRRQALQRLQRRRQRLQADLERWLSIAGDGQRQADALFAVPDRLATGAPVLLPDYRTDGIGEIRVEVPAGKRLHAYAQELMRRAQRSKRAQQRIAEELRAVEAEEAALLRASEPELQENIVPAAPASKKAKKNAGQWAIGQRVIDGFLIQWGKNARANEYLSFRAGKPHDLWLHVQDVQGSHVLIRRDNAQTPVPAAVLQAAAEIALQESQSHALSAEVDWTELRQVSRHPQGGPGRVIYRRFQTLRVRRPGAGRA